MKLPTMALLACGAAVALAGCATGGNDRNDREPIRALLSADALMFTSFDADGDLNVSTAEIEAGIGRELARADANHDGVLQPIEFQNWSNAVLGGGSTGPYRLDFDRNVDNTITADEFRTELTLRARDYDSNENGLISRDEFIRLVGQARQPTGPGMRPRPDGRPG
jgi:ABC-type oligopeptide transport system substrate-binding subunit